MCCRWRGIPYLRPLRGRSPLAPLAATFAPLTASCLRRSAIGRCAADTIVGRGGTATASARGKRSINGRARRPVRGVVESRARSRGDAGVMFGVASVCSRLFAQEGPAAKKNMKLSKKIIIIEGIHHGIHAAKYTLRLPQKHPLLSRGGHHPTVPEPRLFQGYACREVHAAPSPETPKPNRIRWNG